MRKSVIAANPCFSGSDPTHLEQRLPSYPSVNILSPFDETQRSPYDSHLIEDDDEDDHYSAQLQQQSDHSRNSVLRSGPASAPIQPDATPTDDNPASLVPVYFSEVQQVILNRLTEMSAQFTPSNYYNPTEISIADIHTFGDTFEQSRTVPNVIGAKKRKNRRKGPVPKLFKDERCKVCGDRATGFHYNVVSCEGCKGFFRRAALETKVYRCKGQEVGKCMEDHFLQRKCKECRYQACLSAGMRKEFLQGTKKVKKADQGSTSSANPPDLLIPNIRAIDPGQQRLLLIAVEFWKLYKSGVPEAMAQPPQPCDYTNDVLKNMMSKLKNMEIAVPEWDNDNTAQGQVNRMSHMMSMANIHKQFIIRIAEALPYYGNLTAQTKDTLLREALIEIIVLRAASCYNTESDGIKSINGAEYNIQTLQRGGATSAFTSFLREFMDAVTKLKLKECDFAILSIMCLMSPDRGTEVGKRDRQQLCRIQEIFAQILLTKITADCEHEEEDTLKPGVRFASFISLLTRLRMVSHTFSQRFNSVTTAYAKYSNNGAE